MSSMAEVAGRNARALRLAAGAKLEDMARAVKVRGLPWSTGRVGDFEGGRAAPSLPTLFVVAAALGELIGRPVTLAELFAGDDDVRVNDELGADLAAVRAAVSGEGVDPALRAPAPGHAVFGDAALTVTATPATGAILDARAAKIFEDVRATLGHQIGRRSTAHAVGSAQQMRVLMAFSESDTRMCKNVGLEPGAGAAVMAKLWGNTFRHERDRRAGITANAQRRGQVSRQLKAELQEAIADGDDR